MQGQKGWTSKQDAIEKYAYPAIEKYADQLSEKQREFLEKLSILEDLSGTKEETIKKCGFQKSTFYEWVKKDYFRSALDEIFKARTGIELVFAMPAVDKSLISEAKNGSSRHQKIFYQRSGLAEFIPQQTNVNVAQQVGVNLSPEERAELIRVREEQLLKQIEDDSGKH